MTGKEGALSNHKQLQFHQASALRACEFDSRASDRGSRANDVRSLSDSSRRKEADQNRAFFFTLVDILMTCARQDIALRGHRDDGAIDGDAVEPE